MWTEKYKPKKFEEIIGNKKAIEELKKYSWKKPLLLYGPPGTGKTTLTKIIAEIQGNRVDSHPPRAPIRRVSPAEAKRDLMNELRDLIEKRNKKLEGKE